MAPAAPVAALAAVSAASRAEEPITEAALPFRFQADDGNYLEVSYEKGHFDIKHSQHPDWCSVLRINPPSEFEFANPLKLGSHQINAEYGRMF